MRPPFYSKSFQTCIEDAFQKLQDFLEPLEDADKESLALYAKVHKHIATAKSQIVDNFDEIAPYRNQDEISDIEMADIDDGQTISEVDVDNSRDRDEVAEEEEHEVGEEEEEEERGHSKDAYIPSFFVPLLKKIHPDNKATVIARAFQDDLYITPQAQCSVEHFRNIIVPSAKPMRLQGKRPTLLDEDKLAFRRICYRFPQAMVQEISSDSDWERNEIEVKMLKALEAVAAEVGAAGNPTAIAIAYVMHRTPYVFPIIGGRKVEHLKANI
ncbi:hypothetical protein EDD18DRAFT_1357358 [Armillaria luteobubalina]|uniref:NADP-dependent oxidoreductase domain-containing protein n=1 Tax=Armillaria luteobubalina TaxID=153913 RepID=A0AA39UU57_9AGAR|nr:hypothetical protein EDD18DRAFT_1357358 [Armillaria luteobubalina]